MSFDVVVVGTVQRTLYRRLSDLIGESSIHTEGGTSVLRVQDQPALLTVVTYLNDLGMTIEEIHRVR